MLITQDRTQVVTTTTGTGQYALGSAVSGYNSFTQLLSGAHFVAGSNRGCTNVNYMVTDGTNYEVGIGTLAGPAATNPNTLFRTIILRSSNSNNAVNWGAGSKTVSIVYGALNIPGSASAGNEFSSTLSSWPAFQRIFLKVRSSGISRLWMQNQGTTNNDYSQNTGINSRNFLQNGGGSAYFSGAAMDSLGTVHITPHSTPRGHRYVAGPNLAATYNLPYTASNAYSGAVFLPEVNEVHFIPYAANRGTRVSNKLGGTIATYSIPYSTVGGAYSGGSFSPNGDFHFAPFSANRGMKLSPAGVVSTYSLPYTATGAYIGAVTSPRGEVHFVPNNAQRGMKVQTDGTVSTYGLLRTGTNQYCGGALAADGSIHFATRRTTVGQKVSINNVVSTYTLSISSTANDYFKGALTLPSGDVLFTRNTSSSPMTVDGFTNITYTYPFSGNHAASADALEGGVYDMYGGFFHVFRSGPWLYSRPLPADDPPLEFLMSPYILRGGI